MKFKTLLFTLIFTASPIAMAVDYGKLSDSVDKERQQALLMSRRQKARLARMA
jgi:hypothetical protein